MKYIIIEFESVHKFADGTSTKTEAVLVEFQEAVYTENGAVNLIDTRIIKRKNPNAVIEFRGDHNWRYIESGSIWYSFSTHGLSQGYYEKNVIDNKDDAELLFELKE